MFLCVLTRLAFIGTPAEAAYGGLRLPYPPGRAYVVTQTPGAYQNCAAKTGPAEQSRALSLDPDETRPVL